MKTSGCSSALPEYFFEKANVCTGEAAKAPEVHKPITPSVSIKKNKSPTAPRLSFLFCLAQEKEVQPHVAKPDFPLFLPPIKTNFQRQKEGF